MLGINFMSGNIIFEEFHICFSKPYSEQLDNLSEDLVQVVYEGDYILDVGWYPEQDQDGNFVVQIIQGGDWEHPIQKKSCREQSLLIKYISESVVTVESMAQQKNFARMGKMSNRENNDV